MAEIFWAMKKVDDSKLGFFCGTYLTRKDGIKAAEKDFGRPWRKMYSQGYRMVRVYLTEKPIEND